MSDARRPVELEGGLSKGGPYARVNTEDPEFQAPAVEGRPWIAVKALIFLTCCTALALLLKQSWSGDVSHDDTRGINILGIAAKELEPSASFKELLAGVPSSSCPRNTFALEWGSTGVKIYRAHHWLPGTVDVVLDDDHDVKMAVPHSKKAMIELLNELQSKLTGGTHVGGISFSTAGFRIDPHLERLWKPLRRWNEAFHLFKNCTSTDHAGCHTLPGSVEARHEMTSMRLAALVEDEKFLLPVGMASCGGASIQVGIVGGDDSLMEACVDSMGSLSAKHDKSRARERAEVGSVFFSWLADHNEAPTSASESADYLVGGIQEMRAQFDTWLSLKGETSNPCISSVVNRNFTTGGVCDLYVTSGTSSRSEARCLVDFLGNYITRIPGSSHASRKACNVSVSAFLGEDKMLRSWRNSDACKALAQSAKSWGFVTSFGREEQLGYNVDGQLWSEIEEAHLSATDQSIADSAEVIQAGAFGSALSSVMLMEFLRQLGLAGSAQVKSMDAKVAVGELESWNMALGWTDC